MAKVKNDYFKMIENQVSKSVEASELLVKILNDYDYKNIPSRKEEMHRIENEADRMHHEILGMLYAEFITPIDQEDILRLVQIIDDITDAIDEVVMDCYMYYVTDLPEFAAEFAEVVNKCVKHLFDAATEFRGFKKPEKIKAHLAKVNDEETVADKLYQKAIHAMFSVKEAIPSYDVLIVIKALYDSLEECCDLCEEAADLIEQVIIKNT